MELISKKLKLVLAASVATVLFSCNNTENTVASETTAKDSSSTVAPAPAPAFTPFDVLEISHKVKDYDKWRPAFNADSVARKAAGMEDIVVGRKVDNQNDLMVVLKVSDVQKAKDFAADPRLKDVMDKNGVISKPEASYFHVIRFNAESNEKKWVQVTHKVKDFDAWLKVFDNEGTANRATQGLIDVVLARGIDDPNMVCLVFDIKDMDKAKASIMSEDKKKLMMSAGVEGTPKIEFFTSAD
jgi:hypothetical protein